MVMSFRKALEDKEQGSLVRCSPWGRKELDTTERLNNNKGNAWANSMGCGLSLDSRQVWTLSCRQSWSPFSRTQWDEKAGGCGRPGRGSHFLVKPACRHTGTFVYGSLCWAVPCRHLCALWAGTDRVRCWWPCSETPPEIPSIPGEDAQVAEVVLSGGSGFWFTWPLNAVVLLHLWPLVCLRKNQIRRERFYT